MECWNNWNRRFRRIDDNHNEFVFIRQVRELVFVHVSVFLDKQCAPPTIGRDDMTRGVSAVKQRRRDHDAARRHLSLRLRRISVGRVFRTWRNTCISSSDRVKFYVASSKDRLTRWISRVRATISVGFSTFSRTWYENKREKSYIRYIDLSCDVYFFFF